MSKLQELIERYCPDGVEYKMLGELGTFYRGSSFQKKHFVEEGEPCIHYGQVHTQFNLSTDHVVSYLDPSFASKMKKAKPGDLIIATTSEDDEAVGKAIAWMGDTEVVVSNDAYIYSHSLDPMYMAYVFASDLYQQPKLKYVTGTKVRRVHEKNISKIVIPVPPIEVQREIVRLLDAYTAAHDALVAKLKEEMELRAISEKNLLRSLIQLGEKREMTVGDVCHIERGKVISKNYIRENEGEYPVYSSQTKDDGVLGYISSYAYDGEYLTWTTDGANAGSVFYRNGRFSITNVCGLLQPDTSQVMTKYLMYQLRFVAKDYVSEGMGNPKLMSNTMSRIKIEIPSLEEQAIVVEYLDRYVANNGEVSDCLVEEVALRESQLTEFRNQLLSFPEKAA